MADKDYTVRINGREIPHGPSETGDFGLSKEELELIIHQELYRRGPVKQRVLFSHVCRRVKKRPEDQMKEKMLKVFMGVLRGMRDNGRLNFRSGETATYVELPRKGEDSGQTFVRGSREAQSRRVPTTTRKYVERRGLRMAQSDGRTTKAVKELLDEKEVNHYLRLGWTLIKTLRGDTKANGEPCVKYILAWQLFRRPSYPRKKSARN